MENAQKHYTKFGNLKAPSKTDMCNFVVKAWKEGVSQEVIVKSFVVCGIAKNTSPDQISCLKEDRPAHEALPVVLEGWTITHDERPELQDSEEEDELDTAEGLTLCDQNDK